MHASASSHSSSLACKCSLRRHTPQVRGLHASSSRSSTPQRHRPRVSSMRWSPRPEALKRMRTRTRAARGTREVRAARAVGRTVGTRVAMRTWRRPACKYSPRRHFPTGVWCAALLSLCCRPRPIESAAATSQAHQAFEALASIALHKSDTSSQQHNTSSQQALPLSLLSVAACLAVLPPTRAAELADSLCEAELGLCSRPACKCSPRRPPVPTGEAELGLLDMIRWALGPLAAGVRTGGAAVNRRAAAPAAAAPLGAAEGSDASGELPLGTSPRALAASLRLVSALLRYDGAPRRQAYIELPILGRPAALASLLGRADLSAVPSVQAAGCALVRVLLTNAGSGGGTGGGGGAGGGGGLRRSEGGSCCGLSTRQGSEASSTASSTASSALDEYFEAALAALVAHGHDGRSAASLEIACDASEVLGVFALLEPCMQVLTTAPSPHRCSASSPPDRRARSITKAPSSSAPS